jgi:hypothetical protein
MEQAYCYDTDEYPDRRERRMAECLVAEPVPFDRNLGTYPGLKSRACAPRFRSSGTVCVRAAEHADDGDSLVLVVDPVDHAVGAAAGAVAVIQRWS